MASLDQMAEQLKSGETTPSELLKEQLGQIDNYDEKLQAFLEVEREQALEHAQQSDVRWANNEQLSAYDGLVVGVKDNMVTKGRRTSCGSRILDGYVSPFTAHAIEKLHEQGIITLGRLNMDEFAMGSSTENSAYQVTRNPHNLEKAPGGSSGGSAAAVASGMLPVALGSDTGGSIRQPAAFCGTVGLKPTYGTVSRYGLVAFASSLDQIGPLASTVDDARTVYDIIRGFDRHDSTTVLNKDYKNLGMPGEHVRIGLFPELVEQCDESVQSSYNELIDYLKSHTSPAFEFHELKLKHYQYGIPVYYITATSEASANLARFDGIRYGNRAKVPEEARTLEEVYEYSRTQGLGAEVKRRILLGTFALSSGYYDAYYGQAQKVRTLIKQDYLQAFETVDALLLPTTPSPAFSLGDKVDDPVQMYLSDVLTVGASLAGLPSLNVPGPAKELPIGFQLQGPYFSEPRLFELGKVIEKQFPSKIAQFS